MWGLLSETSAYQRIIISLLCLVLVLVLQLKCCHFTNTYSTAINISNSQDECSMFQCCHLQCNLEGQAGQLFGITHPSGIKHLLHSNNFPFFDVCFRAQLWRQHFPLCWCGHRAGRWVDILLVCAGVIGALFSQRLMLPIL